MVFHLSSRNPGVPLLESGTLFPLPILLGWEQTSLILHENLFYQGLGLLSVFPMEVWVNRECGTQPFLSVNSQYFQETVVWWVLFLCATPILELAACETMLNTTQDPTLLIRWEPNKSHKFVYINTETKHGTRKISPTPS